MTDLLNPPPGTLRTIFLYVGQGESTLFIIPDGIQHRYLVVDSNRDASKGGTDLAALLKGKIPEGELIFVNTHPHHDHLRGIKEIHDSVGIGELWHSGHTPGPEDRVAYDEMKGVIEKIGCENVYFLRGSREANVLHRDREETSKVIRKIGDVDYRVFSPAKYVCEEINQEDPAVRRQRIHDQCGVIQFEYNGCRILITGDADKDAWQEHITEYHGDDLKSTILSAVHHGSRTFFKDSKESTDIYEEHIKKIAPEYLVISAPKDSPFDHPHDDAMELYRKYIARERIVNLGECNACLVVDVDIMGGLSMRLEESVVKEFPVKQVERLGMENPGLGSLGGLGIDAPISAELGKANGLGSPYVFKPKSKPYLA